MTAYTIKHTRTYLKDFFAEFSYEAEDAEYMLTAYDRLTATEETSELWKRAISLYRHDKDCGSEAILTLADRAAELSGVHEYTAELLIFMCLSERLRELYAERDLPPKLYRDSMSDLRYKLEVCKLIYGVPGGFSASWSYGFFALKRFGIGRLQFDVRPFGAHYNGNGVILTPDTKVIGVHIPRSGKPLTEEACNDAYRKAKEFFRAEVTTEPCPFTCDSWLMYPGNEDILPKHTNTYRFFKSYDVYEYSTDKARRELWRLFDTLEQSPDRLPTDTSMRRAFVKHLKNGGKLGTGKGVHFV